MKANIMEHMRRSLTNVLSRCYGLERRRRHNESGFSLIETMITMSIFTVGIMAVGAMLVYSTRTRVFNKQLNKGTTIGHNHLEYIRKYTIREDDVRYNAVLNFNYILSRDPNYGTLQGYHLPGFLSGSDGYDAAEASLDAKLAGGTISTDEYNDRIDKIMVLYDDGDLENHGDETANDGIYSCIDYVNMDTNEVKSPDRYNALTTAEKAEWKWILKRRTILEPISVDKVAEGDPRRTISHASLNTADITDTTGADTVRLTVECSWEDMTRKERSLSFYTIIARSTTM